LEIHVFRNVARATLRGQVISHTLMTVGVVAALVVGQWATAAVVVFFMRVGDYAERFTAVYNVVGLSLAALGFLPAIFAAAAQSLPDLGILGNSARLLKQK
jgi:cation transport ATPase